MYCKTSPATYYKRNNKARSRDHCCRGKAINITYSECVPVALGIQPSMRMRRIILPSVSCPALPHFSTLSHKLHDFRKKKYLSVFFFSKTFVWSISRYTLNTVSYCHKYTYWYVFTQINCYSCHISMKLTFSRQISENPSKYQISLKPVQW